MVSGFRFKAQSLGGFGLQGLFVFASYTWGFCCGGPVEIRVVAAVQLQPTSAQGLNAWKGRMTACLES